MHFDQFIEWAFLGSLSVCAPAIVTILWSLNTKIAIVIEKVSGHESRLDRLDDEVYNLRRR
jgi:hypothetical protein